MLTRDKNASELPSLTMMSQSLTPDLSNVLDNAGFRLTTTAGAASKVPGAGSYDKASPRLASRLALSNPIGVGRSQRYSRGLASKLSAGHATACL